VQTKHFLGGKGLPRTLEQEFPEEGVVPIDRLRARVHLGEIVVPMEKGETFATPSRPVRRCVVYPVIVGSKALRIRKFRFSGDCRLKISSPKYSKIS